MNPITLKIEKLVENFGSLDMVAKALRISKRHLWYLKKGDRKATPHLDLLMDMAIDYPEWFCKRI